MPASVHSLAVVAPAVFIVCLGCGPAESGGPDAGTADAGVVIQGGEARGDLVVNEVAPRPQTGPDWFELHNRSAAAIDLCEYFVTDSLDRLDHYSPLGGVAPPESCPPRWLEAGDYYLVFADDTPALGPEHARFKLGVADAVHVVTRAGLPMDNLVYLYPDGATEDELVLARAPDGQGPFYLIEPTPGAPNPEVP